MPGEAFWNTIDTTGGGASGVVVARSVGSGSADYATSTSTWAAVDSSNLALTFAAATSDELEFTFTGTHFSSVALEAMFSIYSVNRAAHIFGTDGIAQELSNTGGLINTAFSVAYQAQAGDISGGNATFHLYWARISTGTLTLKNSSGRPLPRFSAKNFG